MRVDLKATNDGCTVFIREDENHMYDLLAVDEVHFGPDYEKRLRDTIERLKVEALEVEKRKEAQSGITEKVRSEYEN